MVMLKEKQPKKNVIDSCVGRRCYENPAYFDMLKMKVPNLSTSTTVFTTVSEYEINKRAEYGFEELHLQLESSIGSEIPIEQISYEMHQLGIWLCDNIEGLHLPDNQILAYAMLTDSVLITCDKGLENAAMSAGQDVINPDRPIITRAITKTDFSKLVQKKVSQIKQKMYIPAKTFKTLPAKTLQKSVRKITWDTFA
jgi:predicted nuclease of predicted toxin-antitoxin system